MILLVTIRTRSGESPRWSRCAKRAAHCKGIPVLELSGSTLRLHLQICKLNFGVTTIQDKIRSYGPIGKCLFRYLELSNSDRLTKCSEITIKRASRIISKFSKSSKNEREMGSALEFDKLFSAILNILFILTRLSRYFPVFKSRC